MVFHERRTYQHQKQNKASGVTFMGNHHHKKLCQVTILIITVSLVQGSNIGYDHESLDEFFCNITSIDREKTKTGVIYNVPLPSNFTGMELSVARLRTTSLWLRGFNHSYVNLPPKIVPRPNVKRIAILYENLGNLSSHYYNVPNYTMVAPVFGFMAYSSSEKSLIICEKVNLILQGEPIRIKFCPNVDTKKVTPVCARFGDDGSVKLSNMTKPCLCESNGLGHYTIVIPKENLSPVDNERKRLRIWGFLGFLICLSVLVILVLVVLCLVKDIKKRRIEKMEKVSEGGEPFDTFWIGETKLPLATMIRTQPALEHDDSVRS